MNRFKSEMAEHKDEVVPKYKADKRRREEELANEPAETDENWYPSKKDTKKKVPKPKKPKHDAKKRIQKHNRKAIESELLQDIKKGKKPEAGDDDQINTCVPQINNDMPSATVATSSTSEEQAVMRLTGHASTTHFSPSIPSLNRNRTAMPLAVNPNLIRNGVTYYIVETERDGQPWFIDPTALIFNDFNQWHHVMTQVRALYQEARDDLCEKRRVIDRSRPGGHTRRFKRYQDCKDLSSFTRRELKNHPRF